MAYTLEPTTVDLLGDAPQRLVIHQDNVLTRSAYAMSVNEKRLLMLAMSRFDPRHQKKKGDRLEATITARDWDKAYPGRNKPYEDLSKAANMLQRRLVTIHPTEDYFECLNWTSRCRYYKGSNLDAAYVHIVFGVEVSGLLADLHDFYTHYDLLECANFRSIHSIRMYELLCQMQDKTGSGWLKITLDELKLYLCPDSNYSRPSDFVKHAVVTAINEINAKSDLECTLEVKKQGRKFHSIVCRFKPKEQLEIQF